MDNRAESARTSCAITVDVNWATRHSLEAARKLPNSNLCEQTTCATGCGCANTLILLRKPKLSTEQRVLC
ncbi:hypothetical protein DIE23_16890 [Burkholderia sp. Bp9143]|nr:hypothetical protein DIE23_16890 [Burkholderia sp. Bp9143]